MPDHPTSYDQLIYAIPSFPFGLQLVRTTKPLESLTFGLPLESTTNSASRQHLKTLKTPSLSLTFGKPTTSLFSELRELADTTSHLTIRYVPQRGFVDSNMFLSDPLQAFPRIELYLLLPRPRMMMVGSGDNRTIAEDPESPAKRFVTELIDTLEISSEEMQERYTVWLMDGWDIPGRAHKATKTKLWPKEAFWDMEAEIADEEKPAQPEDKRGETIVPTKAKGKQAYWERETNLRLLGGLFNLRLESKKR